MFQPINSAIDTYDRGYVIDFGNNDIKVFNEGDPINVVFSFGSDILKLNEHSAVMPDIKFLSAGETSVANEVLAAADAENTEKTFTFELANDSIKERTVVLTDSTEEFTVSEGVFSGDKTGTGSIDAINGVVTITFNTAPTAEITVSYDHTKGSKLFVSDPFNHCVRVFDTFGNLTATLGSFGTTNGKFNFPAGLEIDPVNSNLHVVDSYNHRVSVFDASTLAFVQNYGSNTHESDEGLYYPMDIIYTDAGMYVTDTGHNRIVLFTVADAVYSESASAYVTKDFNAIEDSDRFAILALATDDHYTAFYCSDMYSSNIQKFNSIWVKQDDVTTKGKAADKTYSPKGLISGGATILLVCDTGNKRYLPVDMS